MLYWYEYYDSEEQEFWEEEIYDRRTSKIKEWEKLCDETGKCTRCPPHRGENSTKGKFKKKSKLKYQIRRDKKFLNAFKGGKPNVSPRRFWSTDDQ